MGASVRRRVLRRRALCRCLVRQETRCHFGPTTIEPVENTLTARQDELVEQYDAPSEDDENAYEEGERLESELNEATAAIQALEARTHVCDPQQMAEPGAFVILDSQGNLIIERGLVRHDGPVKGWISRKSSTA